MHSPLKKLLANVEYGLTIRLVDPCPNVGINSGYFINISISISISISNINIIKHLTLLLNIAPQYILKKQLKETPQNYRLDNISAFSPKNLATSSHGSSLKSTNFLFNSYFSYAFSFFNASKNRSLFS